MLQRIRTAIKEDYKGAERETKGSQEDKQQRKATEIKSDKGMPLQ